MAQTKAEKAQAARNAAVEKAKFNPVNPLAGSLTGETGRDSTEVAAIKEPVRTPQYDSMGKIIGYLVTTYNVDGTANPATFEAAKIDNSKSTSAYDMITLELQNKGLGSLVEPLKKFFQEGITDSDTLRLKLSQTPEYQTRFSANAERIKNGLSALTPAEYVQLEDQYQNVMRNYGLPATYWTKDATGKQAGFDALLSGDVSAAELEDRVMTAQERVLNANPEVSKALKQFYGDTITDGDILAYALDPSKALTDIKRKVTAAEIGGAAMQAGLNQGTTPEMYKSYAARAAELEAAGVTQQQAQQNYGTIAQLAQRGSQLASIYGQQPYGQTQAEAELFNIQGQTQAAEQRKKITGLEKAAFSASSGAAQNALNRDRAMGSGNYRSSGAGNF